MYSNYKLAIGVHVVYHEPDFMLVTKKFQWRSRLTTATVSEKI